MCLKFFIFQRSAYITEFSVICDKSRLCRCNISLGVVTLGGVKAVVSAADTEAGTLPLYPVVMENSGIMSLFRSILEHISGIMCLPLAILTIGF